jgi:hypothetical protein
MLYELWHNGVGVMSRAIERTTVVFPASLKKRAMARARARRISFSEFVRQAVDRAAPPAPRKQWKGRDPLWSDVPVYDGPVPADLSVNHDKYLYDEDS